MSTPGDATATAVPVKPDPKPAATKNVSAPKQPTKEPEPKQPEAKQPPAKETLPTPRAEPAPARKKDEGKKKIAVGVCVAVVAIVIPLVCKLMHCEKEDEEEESEVAKGGARVVVDKLVGWVKEIRGEEGDESKSEDYGEVSIPYEAAGTVEGFTNAQSL